MSSYLIIELDTTPPLIELHAPRYTTKEAINEITIEANERLSDFQEIYVIDKNGVRYDYTFQQTKGNQFVGRVSFSNLPYGIATIFTRVKDEVDNYSSLIYKSFEIKETLSNLRLQIDDKNRHIKETKSNREIATADVKRNFKVDDKLILDLHIGNTARKVDMTNPKEVDYH